MSSELCFRLGQGLLQRYCHCMLEPLQAQEKSLTCQMLCAEHCHPMITLGKERVFADFDLDANLAAAICRFSNLLKRSSAF